MIAERTLKRAALTSAITFGVLAVPTVSAWWAGAPQSVPTAAKRSVPSIGAAPRPTLVRQAKHPQLAAPSHAPKVVTRTKTQLSLPDYSQFVVRLGRTTVDVCE